MSLQAAIVVSSCVLVGYANIDYPPPDPAWRVRQVCFGDGAMSPSNPVLDRDPSQTGWTGVYLAHEFGRGAAVAWDRTIGLQFVTIDKTGMVTAPPVNTSVLPGRDILVVQDGFTMLQSPFDEPRTPVMLTSLDTDGSVVGTPRELVDDSSSILGQVARVAFEDRSFLLLWRTPEDCDGCQTLYGQHFSEVGDALGSRAYLHAFSAESIKGYEIAASSVGVVAGWFERAEDGSVAIHTAPFDFDGGELEAPSAIVSDLGPNSEAFALASAPGGDLLAAYSHHIQGLEAELNLQPLTPNGGARGDEVTVRTFRPTNNKGMRVVATSEGGMLLYESEVPNVGSQIFAIPLQCAW
jgi:hypothetical protein